MESETARAQIVETLLIAPEQVSALKRRGVYGAILAWLANYRRGFAERFPFATGARVPVSSAATYGGGGDAPDRIVHETPRWTMYSTPIPTTASAGTGSSASSGSWSNPGYGGPHPSYRTSAPAPATTTPRTTGTEMVVSPAAKALDYFQEALELLGIDESEDLTYERLKAAYKRTSLRAHPDKGGSKEAFDEVSRAFRYVGKILERIRPSAADTEQMKTRMTAPVTLETAKAHRAELKEAPPVKLSAKKLDMSMFNKLFEENRLPDPSRDSGYGDWLKGQGGGDEALADPRLKGKFNQEVFEQVFREKAHRQTAGVAIVKRLEPDAIVSAMGTELGGDTSNFTAAMGADTHFTDIKEAYTTGATVFHEVADVRVTDRRVRSVEEAKRAREEALRRVDPDESARIAAAAAALEERERQRRLRLAAQDTASEDWSAAMRRRLFVMNG